MAEMPIAQLTSGKPPNVCEAPAWLRARPTTPTHKMDSASPIQNGIPE